MPVVLRINGFRILVLLPPREHGPAHVHVVKANGLVVIGLAYRGEQQQIRRIREMRTSDVLAAFRLVETHTAELIAAWRKYHGEA
jgi:hypothetical protein